MVSLTTVYDFLKSSSNYTVLLEEPVSYLQKITLAKNKCIFICKKELTEDGVLLTPSQYLTKTKNNDENLNLTGSPLKDDCNISDLELSSELLTIGDDQFLWKQGEQYLKPIQLDKARSVLCDLKLRKQGKEADSTGDMWILCDASDYDKTILLNLKFLENFNSSGIVKFRGLISPSKINTNELIKLHKCLINNVIKSETLLDSYYNIKPNITLKLNWSTISRNFDLNYTKNANVMLFQTIKIDNALSVCEGYWRQLIILNLIKDDIVHYKLNNNLEVEYKRGTGIDMDLLKERVEACMTEISNMAYPSENNGQTIEEVVVKLKLQPPNDLTDKLWDIIRSCASYRDLKTAFSVIFQRAALRNVINMPTNDNCLAEIIREISHRRLAIPRLSGTEPLELLLEIGLEKLYKDYEHIFTESKICTSNCLQIIEKRNSLSSGNLKVRNTLYNAAKTDIPNKERQTLLHANQDTNDETEIIGFQNSKFNRQDVEMKLNNLSKIHLSLEHLLCIQNNLNLENVYVQMCAQLLNRKMQPLEELLEMNYDKIEIPLSLDKIIPHIENKDPQARRISIKSENKYREIHSIYYFNLDNIFPPNIFNELNIDDEEISTENMYFYYNYVQVNTNNK